MKKFNVKGYIQITIQIDEIVTAENEREAHSFITDNSPWDCNSSALEITEIGKIE